jgi:hypothetical protein
MIALRCLAAGAELLFFWELPDVPVGIGGV